MSKYFSKDSDLSHYNLNENDTVDTTAAIPSTDNLTQPLSNEVKQQLSQTSTPQPQRTPKDAVDEDDYIDLVKDQTEQVSQMINQYSEEAKQEIKNQFNKFAPAEMFEKMNQIIFVLAQLNDKVNNLERTIVEYQLGGIPNPPQNPMPQSEENVEAEMVDRPINSPSPQQNASVRPQGIPTQQKPSQDMPDVNEVRKQLGDIKSGKVPSMPDEGYSDNSVNLEEMFPNLDSEAYEAAYSSMAKTENTPKTESKRPSPGKMRGITGF